ncbi:MAG: hypothetical protein L0211_13045, partial [Planctomycetaceae bacterium]|nr:hypothetical protein [Planctomycetaceae bacterium]
MTAKLPNPRRASRLLAPAGDLVLHVRGAEHEGRELRIRSPKCTIGSARGCTLRLSAAGVGPLHCWILRGAGGTIVRRRDPRTRLNGRRFVDAPLAPGDRLQIGSVELEVADCPKLPAEWTIQSADLPEQSPADSWIADTAHESAQQSAQETEQLRAEFHNLQRRAAEQLGEVNAQIDRMTEERAALAEQLRMLEEQSTRERGELAEKLAAADAEFAQQRAQFTERMRTMESEAHSERDSLVLEKDRMQLSLAASEQELAELRRSLSSRESEIESKLHAESQRVTEMQGRLEQAARERAQLEKQLQKKTESLYSKLQAREAERDRLAEQCQRLEQQAAQLRELLGYTSAERDQLSLRLDSREQNSYDQQRKIAAEKEELQRRLDTTLAKLTGANSPLTPSASEPASRQTELVQGSDLRQLTEELMLEKQTLEGQIEQQTSVWQRERESLRQQTERVTEHCKQVDEQLSHVRGLLETLVSERDAIGQQLTAADVRLVTEQQQWQEQRASLERQIQGQSSSSADMERQLSELAARVEVESSRAIQSERRAEESAQQLANAETQLAEAVARLAQLQSESDARIQSETARAEQLGREGQASRDELASTQVALADAEASLAVLRVERASRLQSEQEQLIEARRRCEELTRDLATADLRLTEAERKLAAFRIGGDERLNQSLKRHSELEQLLKAADEELAFLRQQLETSEARCGTLQVELDAQQAAHQQSKEAAAVRWALLEEQTTSLLEQLEGRNGNATQVLPSKDGLQTELKRANEARRLATDETSRLEEECRKLRQRLAEKDRELAGLAEQLNKAGDVSPTGCVTVPYAQLKQNLAAGPIADDQFEEWDAERSRLQQRIAELEQQLDPNQCSQNVTLGADAIAQLQSQSGSAATAEETANLKAQLDALKSELAEANS